MARDGAEAEAEARAQNISGFFDDAGDLTALEAQVDLTVLHRNAQTGKTLTDKDLDLPRFGRHRVVVVGCCCSSD